MIIDIHENNKKQIIIINYSLDNSNLDIGNNFNLFEISRFAGMHIYSIRQKTKKFYGKIKI